WPDWSCSVITRVAWLMALTFAVTVPSIESRTVSGPWGAAVWGAGAGALVDAEEGAGSFFCSDEQAASASTHAVAGRARRIFMVTPLIKGGRTWRPRFLAHDTVCPTRTRASRAMRKRRTW